MNIEKTAITKLTITGAKALDPIHVFMEDIEPGKGRITINCYTKSWTAYWGGMSNRTIAQFFCSCDEGYLSNNLTNIESSVFDADAVEAAMKKNIFKMRRAYEIDANEARDMFEEASVHIDNPWNESRLMEKHFGEEWWHSMPSKVNPEFAYLCRIIKAVQEGLALDMKQSAAAVDEVLQAA